MTYEKIDGGVCAAKGFKANGIRCGIREGKTKKDLALIVSEVKCTTAAVYTKNLVKGAPLTVTRNNIADGYAQAIICNSGNANTCNANGIEIAEGMCALVEKATGISAKDVIVASTGVIGQTLSLAPISKGIGKLAEGLSDGIDASKTAAEAIMTTDTKLKEIAFEFEIDGVTCHIGGITKGSGMIHPNMATMLSFITSDVNITSEMVQKALSADIIDTYNMVSVDRDTSTNDMVSVLCNGLAGNKLIDSEGTAFDAFKGALHEVTLYMAKHIAADGEGASKLLECIVYGAKTKDIARTAAKSLACSLLFKCMMYGEDANWGRVLCAIGYSGADVDVSKISVEFASAGGRIAVCENGFGIDFSEELAKKVLSEKEIEIFVGLHDGNETATAWGCDMTYDYVKINGDYRT